MIVGAIPINKYAAGLNLKSDSWLQKLQLSFSFKSLHNKLPIAPEQQFMYNTEFLHVSCDHRTCLTSRSQCQLSFANAKHNILDGEPSPFRSWDTAPISSEFAQDHHLVMLFVVNQSCGCVRLGTPTPPPKKCGRANSQPPFYFLEVHVTQYVFSFCVFWYTQKGGRNGPWKITVLKRCI